MTIATSVIRLPLSICVLLLIGCQGPNEFQPPPPPKVTVAKPVIQTVPNYLETTGTTDPSDYVEVRARVRGIIDSIEFQPNDEVEVDQVLYKIEQDTYKAALDQANAELAQAKAQVAQAKANQAVAQAEFKRADSQFKRAKELIEKEVITQEEFEQREATFEVADAGLKKAASEILAADALVLRAEAAQKDAEINFDYTLVRSKIKGQVEKTRVEKGNLVDGMEATHLTTVVQFDPMYATFTIPDLTLMNLDPKERKQTENGRVDKRAVKILLGREIDDGFPFSGWLNSYATAIDKDTGTYEIRGAFPNPGRPPKLLPGLFVKIRVWIGELKDAILVPERSVASDQLGRYVLIVNDETRVERRDIVLGTKYGDMVVASEGLDGSEQIVVEGIQRARVGEKVTPKEIKLDPPKDDTGVPEEDDPADDDKPKPNDQEESDSRLDPKTGNAFP